MRKSPLRQYIWPVLLVLLCGCVGVLVIGSLLSTKPCRPIIYPTGKIVTERESIMTSDPIETVLAYYNGKLNVKSNSIADTGDWRRNTLDNQGYMFSCSSLDFNRITTETGCLMVSADASGTRIEAILIKAADVEAQCHINLFRH